eukprot:781545-Ditylum_brightwellii.AAC.1
MWSASIPPPQRTPNFAAWQDREFSSADYQMLLSLDENLVPPLHKFLVNALPPVPLESCSEEVCGLCSSSFANEKSLRRFPCSANHIVHESCALGILMEAQSSGTNSGAAGALCPLCNDNVWLFPSLRRQPLDRNTPLSSINAKVSDAIKCINKSEDTPQTRITDKRNQSGPIKDVFHACIIGTRQSRCLMPYKGRIMNGEGTRSSTNINKDRFTNQREIVIRKSLAVKGH